MSNPTNRTPSRARWCDGWAALLVKGGVALLPHQLTSPEPPSQEKILQTAKRLAESAEAKDGT